MIENFSFFFLFRVFVSHFRFFFFFFLSNIYPFIKTGGEETGARGRGRSRTGGRKLQIRADEANGLKHMNQAKTLQQKYNKKLFGWHTEFLISDRSSAVYTEYGL